MIYMIVNIFNVVMIVLFIWGGQIAYVLDKNLFKLKTR